MSYSVLSVTTSAGTLTVELGNQNSITFDSPNGGAGTPGAAVRTPRTFYGFLEHGRAPGDWDSADPTNKSGGHHVSALSFAAGVITVTQAGVNDDGGEHDVASWTTAVTVDGASNLVVDGFGVAARQTIPLAGLSAISLTEGA